MIDIELLEDYTTEAREVLDDLDSNLIRLEQEGPTSEVLNNIFRAAHSIKGSAEYIGLERSSALTHGVETLLDLMREGMLEITPEVVEFLFKAKDCITSLVDEVAREHEEKTDISEVLAELENLVGGSDKSTEVSEITAIIEESVKEEAPSVEEELPADIETAPVHEEDLETDFMEPEGFFSQSDKDELGDALSKIIKTEEAEAPPEREVEEKAPEEEYEEPEESPTGELDAGTTLEETVPHLLNLSLYLDDLADGIAIEEALTSFSETISRLTRSMEFMQIPEAVTILESLEASVSSLDLAGNQVSDAEISRLRAQLHDLRPCYPGEIFPWPETPEDQEDEEPTKDLVKKEFFAQLDTVKDLDPKYYDPLYEAGFTSLDELRQSSFSVLSNLPGMTDQAAEAVLAALKPEPIEKKIAPPTERVGLKSMLSDVDDDLLNEFEGAFSEAIDTKVIEKAPNRLDPKDELNADLRAIGEDTDKEIMEIFLSYGWEIVDKIHSITDKVNKGTPSQQDLLTCADLVKSIKASSTYMDFQNLALFLDDWYERSLWAAERVDTLTKEELRFIPDSFDRFEKFLHALETAMKPEAAAQAPRPAPVTPTPEPAAREQKPKAKPKPPKPAQEKKPPKKSKPEPEGVRVEKEVAEKPAATVSVDLELETGKAQPSAEEEAAAPVGQYEGDVALTRDSAAESPVVRTMRVDSSKVDLLLNQVGELVVNRSYVEQLSNELKLFQREISAISTVGKDESQMIRDITTKLGEAALSLGRVATDIQEGVMKLRMLPVGQLFNRMPRLIRDLSRRMGKNISLHVMGGDTEVDKRVIEQVYNPLVHLIRNAVDHGIEDKKVRDKLGKKEEGNITLNAYSQGNHVVIDVQDDGGGIDTDKVLQRAVENRLVDPAEAKRISDEDAYNFLFVPGFSTSNKVTRTSGRGVGMDVVKKDVEKISGHVEVHSEPNKGTKISIKIPLTLAIIQALLVKSGKHFFAIPLTSVREIVQIMPHEITTIEGFEVIKFRQETIPILRLGDVFNISVDPKLENEGFLILASAGLKTVGFLVEGLVGEQDVVIKPLAEHVFKSRGLAGSTILGDGTIALVMDVAEIVDDVIASKRKMIALQGNGYTQSYLDEGRPEA